ERKGGVRPRRALTTRPAPVNPGRGRSVRRHRNVAYVSASCRARGHRALSSLREVVGSKGYRELGEPFDDREHKLFGKEAFESVVREVAGVRHARSPEVHARMTLAWLVALVGVIGGTMTAIAGARTGSTLVPSSHCASTSSSPSRRPHFRSWRARSARSSFEKASKGNSSSGSLSVKSRSVRRER